jgi:hypothetical protein
LFLDSRWAVTKSTDHGGTFSTDVKASGWTGGGVCDCCPGAVISSNNISSVLYRDNFSNLRDIWAGISTNSNSSFSSGFTVDNTNWTISSCPATGPDGVIIGDTLYAVFMSGASGTARTYLSKSTLSGGTVNSVTNLTSAISGLTMQNFPRIASDGSAMAIVWTQQVNGNDQLPLLFTNDVTNGFPSVYDTVDLNNITNADVAVSNGNLFIVWEDDNTGTVKFRKGTFTVSATSVNNIETTGFYIFPNPASGLLYIHTPFNEKYLTEIFNSLDEKIYSSEGTSGFPIQISNFQNGIYFVQIKSGGKVFSGKFIKQ